MTINQETDNDENMIGKSEDEAPLPELKGRTTRVRATKNITPELKPSQTGNKTAVATQKVTQQETNTTRMMQTRFKSGSSLENAIKISLQVPSSESSNHSTPDAKISATGRSRRLLEIEFDSTMTRTRRVASGIHVPVMALGLLKNPNQG